MLVIYIYICSYLCVNFMGRQLSVSKGHLASSATQSGKFERSSLRNGWSTIPMWKKQQKRQWQRRTSVLPTKHWRTLILSEMFRAQAQIVIICHVPCHWCCRIALLICFCMESFHKKFWQDTTIVQRHRASASAQLSQKSLFNIQPRFESIAFRI